MCPRDIGGVDHQLFPRCAALTDKPEGRHGGSMGVVMTELQVSIGLDRSDCRAGESMARALVGHRFRAVQQDIAVTVVDWPVVHARNVGDPDFVGR